MRSYGGRIMPNELKTVLGLMLLTAGGALVQFVMIGLIGLMLLPAALVVLIWAIADTRAADTPTGKAWAGFVLGLVGIGALMFVAGSVSQLAFDEALVMARPGLTGSSANDWLITVGAAALASLLTSVAVLLRSPAAKGHALLWAVGVWTVGGLVYLMFSLLAPILPLSA